MSGRPDVIEGRAAMAATNHAVSTDAAPSFAMSSEVVVLSDARSEQAEAVGALRAHLTAQHLPAGRRSLALCSPSRGTGCTALAVNLAISLAETGLKTLLIDGDMRMPGVDGFIIPSRAVPGLQQCLAGDTVEPGEAIQFDVLPNLSVLYAGGVAERPQELLGGARFRSLVDLCLRDFDMTIIDTPPAGQSADARLIATVAGYAMPVIGRNRSFVNDVRVLIEELTADQVKIIGSVLQG